MYHKRKRHKSWPFADFCHHHLAIMSVHMHASHYLLFESGMKEICKQSLHVERDTIKHGIRNNGIAE